MEGGAGPPDGDERPPGRPGRSSERPGQKRRDLGRGSFMVRDRLEFSPGTLGAATTRSSGLAGARALDGAVDDGSADPE